MLRGGLSRLAFPSPHLLVHCCRGTAVPLYCRYQSGEAVYEEDMLHREPGDKSTLTLQVRAAVAHRAGAWAVCGTLLPPTAPFAHELDPTGTVGL